MNYARVSSNICIGKHRNSIKLYVRKNVLFRKRANLANLHQMYIILSVPWFGPLMALINVVLYIVAFQPFLNTPVWLKPRPAIRTYIEASLNQANNCIFKFIMRVLIQLPT